MGSIFLVLETIFRGIGLWDQFSTYVTQKKINDMEVQYQDLVKAVELAKSAKLNSEAYEAQARIAADTKPN